MSETNRDMIIDIREKLNVVNVNLIDPDKFEDADVKSKKFIALLLQKKNFHQVK